MTKRNQIAVAVGVAVSVTMVSQAFGQDLPPVPEYIQEKGVISVGTKCDYVPAGYLDNDGNPVGIEVEMARRVAFYAFGDPDKVELTCVTSANRIPNLVGGKIDLIIATMGVNAERAEVIDFSQPYEWGASAMLVMADSEFDSMDDFNGNTVVSLKGAWQMPWFETNMPEVNLLKLDTVADSLQALQQGRAQGYGHDYSVLSGIAKENDSVRILEERYQPGYAAAGVRKGEEEWLAFVDAVVGLAWTDGTIEEAIKVHVDEELWDDKLANYNMELAPPLN